MKYNKELKDLFEIKDPKIRGMKCKSNSRLGKILINETNFITGNPRTRTRLYYVENDIFEQVKCPTCSGDTNVTFKDGKYIIQFCSTKCQREYIDPIDGIANKFKYAKKSHETMLKIDKETGLSKNDLLGQKIKETNSKIDEVTGLSQYDINGLKTKETKSKIDLESGLTGYQKIGLKTKETQKIKSYKNRLSNFPEEYTLLTTKKEYLKSNLLKYSCNKCHSTIESYWPYIRCAKCYPYNKSIGETEVLNFCQSLTSDVISGDRKLIKPLELDIYLPDHKLAIEYNGLFYHSSYSLDSENKDYHLDKTQECEKRGIQLFHIFENEWVNPRKQEIWKSIIKNRLGQSERIYARKTSIKPVTYKDKSNFLDGNHLQGNCNSSVNLGLYLDDELVSLMTFGISRYNKKIDWELLRFCNKIGYSVIGGASKLLKYFRSKNKGSIISYADKRRSNGKLYKQLGFEFSHDSGPNYWYYKDRGLESRLQYQKHKLKDKLEIFDSDLTESENMYNNEYRKIYDCGNQVWILY